MSRSAPIVGVGALVMRPDGALLLGHRIKAGESATWCMPGGNVEPGESFEQAALREAVEEAGIRGGGGAWPFVVALDASEGLIRVTVGVCVPVESDAAAVVSEPEVFDRWIWTRPEEVPAPLFPATGALLEAWLGRPAPPGWTFYPLATALPAEDAP